MKKVDLSKFVEQAVRAHDTDSDALQALIDDTVREVRAERRESGMADQV